MPSRKKVKGKARKAAKEAAKAKESQEVVAALANQRQVEVESLEAQMVGLQISRSLSVKCRHGLDDTPLICLEFIAFFMPAFLSIFSGDNNMVDEFKAAYEAAGEIYADVYSSKLESVVSILVSSGTQCILGGDIDSARSYAALACHFEEWMAVGVNLINMVKVCELFDADEHTLVKYFRKRIPCHCLDEKYKEVKSVKKLGMCCNPSCSARNVERSKMLCCTGCGVANYCSRECQKANWKSHKELCGEIAKMKAAFQSKES